MVEKVSSLAPGARKYVDVGKFTNNFVVDIDKLREITIFHFSIYVKKFSLNFFQIVPFVIFFFLFLIYLEVEIIVLVVIGALAVLLIIQRILDLVFSQANKKRMKEADLRSNKVNEMIAGAKIIKFHAWEKIMINFVKRVKEKEGSLIFRAFNAYNMSQSMTALIPTVLGILVFLLYETITGKELEISAIYELVTLFNAIVNPIRYFIFGLLCRADCIISCQRINEILQIEPIESLKDNDNLVKGQVEIRSGCFNWEDPKYFKIFEGKEMKEEIRKNYVLRDINLKINQGEFIAVIGQVGAGKSSLLLALMDEMVRHEGDVRKNGNYAYISQEAFLQNETILNNIIFGKKFEREKFDHVLKICQMEPDLEILPGRENTEIGERGVNMSGGQKQRINIARAVYSGNDIILIDDALSALDAYVGKKVMDEVFIKEMAGKTRVMVTHFLNLLDQVDKVILMDKGRIAAFGNFEEVKKTQAFKDFTSSSDQEEGEEKLEIKVNVIEKELESHPIKVEAKEEKEKEDTVAENVKKIETQGGKEEIGKLTKEESRDKGALSTKFFGYYMTEAGSTICVLTFLSFTLSIVAKIACDWWVGQRSENIYKISEKDFKITYALIFTGAVIFFVLRSVLMAFIARGASMKIFKKVSWSILRRPMSFFDTTPTGVIINRITSDVDKIDFLIPLKSCIFLNVSFTFMGSLILAVVVSPPVIILIIISFVIIIKNFVKYLKVGIELERLHQISNSPLISASSEFINGAVIIRNYGKREEMLKKYDKLADVNHSAFLHDRFATLWIRLRVEFTFAFIVVFTIFSVVLDKKYR